MKIAKLLSSLVLMSSLILVGCNNKEKPEDETSGSTSEVTSEETTSSDNSTSSVDSTSSEDSSSSSSSNSDVKVPLSENEIFQLFIDNVYSYKDYHGDISYDTLSQGQGMLYLYDSENVEVKGEKYKTIVGVEYDKAKEIDKDEYNYSYDSKKNEYIEKYYSFSGGDKILQHIVQSKKVFSEYIYAKKYYSSTSTSYKNHIGEVEFYQKINNPYNVISEGEMLSKDLTIEEFANSIIDLAFKETFYSSRPDDIESDITIKELEDESYKLDIKLLVSNYQFDTNVFGKLETGFAYAFDNKDNVKLSSYQSAKVELPLIPDDVDPSIKYKPIQEECYTSTITYKNEVNDKIALTEEQINDIDSIKCSSDDSIVYVSYVYKYDDFTDYYNVGESAKMNEELAKFNHVKIKYYQDKEHTKEIKLSDLTNIHYDTDVYIDIIVDDGYALIKEDKYHNDHKYNYSIFTEVELASNETYTFDTTMQLDKPNVSDEIYNQYNGSNIIKVIMNGKKVTDASFTLKNKGFYEIGYLGE